MENRQVIKMSPLFKNPPRFNKKKWRRKQKKKRKECFEGSKEEFSIGEPSSAKADVHEEIQPSVVSTENPQVKSHKMMKKSKRKKKKYSGTFNNSLVVEPHAKVTADKGKAARHESDVDESRYRTNFSKKPEVKSHHHQEKKKWNEDSSTFEDSLVGEPQAKSPAEKGGKSESRTSDSMDHDEATNLEIVPDTRRKSKVGGLESVKIAVRLALIYSPIHSFQFIMVIIGFVLKVMNPDLLPRGPVVCFGNLSYHVTYSDVENFFKDCGEILNIRFSLNKYQLFDRRGYVEFKTCEAAEKAVNLHGQLLNGSRVVVSLGNPIP
ncbi:hypothetical protein OROGR_016453 [Orobanche gracilis]